MELNGKTRHGPKKSGLLLIKDRFHHQIPTTSTAGGGSPGRCYSLKEAMEAKNAEVRPQPSFTAAPPSVISSSFSATSPVTRRLNNHLEHDQGFAQETISSPERQRVVLPDASCRVHGTMQHHQQTLPQQPTPSASATPPSGISSQRSLHLREKQRMTRKISSHRRMLTVNDCVESDDERLHHSSCCQDTEHVESTKTSSAFRRRDRLRSSLPIVSCRNKSLERPLGMVFLTYRNETKRGVLPNEITSISTVWALFARAFPDNLTMKGFETPQASFVCILNRATNAYRPLTDLREVVDQSALLVPCIGDDNQQMSPHSSVSRKSSLQPTNLAFYHNDRLASTTGETSNVRAGIVVTQSPRCLQRKHCSSMERRQTMIFDGDGRPQRYSAESHNEVSCRLGGMTMRPRTASEGSSRSDGMDSNTRDRLSTVESQLASLRSMVQAAMKQDEDDDDDEMKMKQQQLLPPLPHQQQPQQLMLMSRPDSAQSVHSCSSLVTVRSLNDGCCHDVIDIRDRLGDVRQQLKIIRNEVRDLRQMQMNCSTSLGEANAETVQKIQRENVNAEKLQYKEDTLVTETRLRSLEESVQGLRKNVIGQKTEVTVSEVERMVVELTRINKALTAARGKFRNIQEQMTSLAEMGSKEDDDQKCFLEEEPNRLEKLFSRCRQVTGSLTILKKVAVAQNNQNCNGSKTASLTQFECNGERETPPAMVKPSTPNENEVLTKTRHASIGAKSHTETKSNENQSSVKMNETVQLSSRTESLNKKHHQIEYPHPRRLDSGMSFGVSLLPRIESHASASAAVHPISTGNQLQPISRQSSPSSSSNSSSSSSVTIASPRQWNCSPKAVQVPAARRVPPELPVRRFTRMSSEEVSRSSYRTTNASSTQGSYCDLRQGLSLVDSKAPSVDQKQDVE